jgi:hypothetical protein
MPRATTSVGLWQIGGGPNGPTAWDNPAVQNSHPVYVQYTSGTRGNWLINADGTLVGGVCGIKLRLTATVARFPAKLWPTPAVDPG